VKELDWSEIVIKLDLKVANSNPTVPAILKFYGPLAQ
tara:strand:- start:833 stop:943 length:111 start_codon:yes stop_codon:yes gene_type:complete